MSRTAMYSALVALMTIPPLGLADEIGTAVDLSKFGQSKQDESSVWDELSVQQVADRSGGPSHRLYVSAMLGPSLANVWSPAEDTLGSEDSLLAAGAALGIAFERTHGRLRIEIEGMGRDTYNGELFSFPGDSTILTNNWSAMGNIWRDIMITDRFGMYAGAGIGGGGYVLSDQVGGVVESFGSGSTLAWQGGGGLLWEITSRLTFDVGYRYFRIDSINRAGADPSDFGSSEIMFTLRLFEPLGRWR